MDNAELRRLIKQDEGPKLDFKQEWYAISHSDKKVCDMHWGELIKDILALANGSSGTANQTAHLIIGVADKRNDDGERVLHDIGDVVLTEEQILEKVNYSCHPRLLRLICETKILDEYRILVISIPPTPSLHELTKRITTKKTTFNQGTVFVRRGSAIHPANKDERDAIFQEKQKSTGSTQKNSLQRRIDTLEESINELQIKVHEISVQMSDEEDNQSYETKDANPVYQRLEGRKDSIEGDIMQLRDERDYLQGRVRFEKGSVTGRKLLIRAEKLLEKLFALEAEEDEGKKSNPLIIDEMYREAKDCLERAIDVGYSLPRVYFKLAEIHDYRYQDAMSAFDYCCEGIEISTDFMELHKKRINLYPQLKNTLFEEDAREYLIPDIKVLLKLGRKNYIIKLLKTGFFDAEEDRDIKEKVILLVSES
jgi:hypothetical protein